MDLLELKIIISEVKNSLEGLNFVLNTAEDRINELEDRTIEKTQKVTQREKIKHKNNHDMNNKQHKWTRAIVEEFLYHVLVTLYVST